MNLVVSSACEENVISRRNLLVSAASSILLPSYAQSEAAKIPTTGDDFWKRPRILDIQRKDTEERFLITYWRDGEVDKSGYKKACEVLRDAHVNEVAQMDLRLLDLMCATQSWIRYYGYNVPFLIHSGYRSKATNRKTEGAARDSKHMLGQAVDYTVPGVPSEYMGRLAHLFLKSDGKGGGVGFYQSAQFTHMDTGIGGDRVWVKK
jgi:uncharacterized protein YcbK (DUF882 family)